MYDITICTLPYSNLDHINSAPAILKGVLVSNGYSCKTVDFGCELYKLCERNPNKFYHVQNQYFLSESCDDPETLQIIDQFYNIVIEWFKNNASLHIGVCVFSRYTHKAALEILIKIKQQNISSSVIVGGRGLPVRSSMLLKNQISQLDMSINFSNMLQNKKLVDHVIIGDGEDAILALLRNQPLLLTSNSEQFKHPIPNYDDYDFANYIFPDGKINWPITGSKGCVRDCDFCDIKKHFGKYRYRTGTDIANEMIALSKKYGARKFQFTDSLVNGGLKPFRQFLETLSEFNLANPDKAISWNGQYICKPAEQVPEDIYKLIALSGGEGLTIGAESGSDHVLLAMNKKTTVESLFSELERFQKYKITCNLLMFTGHWSETWDDFVKHCKMIVRCLPYIRSGTISSFLSHPVMAILDQTPSYDNRDQNHVIVSDFDPSMIWACKDNQSNTYKERLFRKLILDRLMKKLQIPMTSELENKTNVLVSLENQIDKINDFYTNLFPDLWHCRAQETYHNFEDFFTDLMIQTSKNKLILELEVCEYNGGPEFQIKLNNQTIMQKVLSQGLHEFEFNLSLDQNKSNQLTLIMSGKNHDTDTLVVDGKIILDKNITIKKLLIDEVNIFNDPVFFQKHFTYTVQGCKQDRAMMGFWQNHSELRVTFEGLFKTWYHTSCGKNVVLSQTLAYRGLSNHDRDIIEQKEKEIVQLASQLYR